MTKRHGDANICAVHLQTTIAVSFQERNLRRYSNGVAAQHQVRHRGAGGSCDGGGDVRATRIAAARNIHCNYRVFHCGAGDGVDEPQADGRQRAGEQAEHAQNGRGDIGKPQRLQLGEDDGFVPGQPLQPASDRESGRVSYILHCEVHARHTCKERVNSARGLACSHKAAAARTSNDPRRPMNRFPLTLPATLQHHPVEVISVLFCEGRAPHTCSLRRTQTQQCR